MEHNVKIKEVVVKFVVYAELKGLGRGSGKKRILEEGKEAHKLKFMIHSQKKNRQVLRIILRIIIYLMH